MLDDGDTVDKPASICRRRGDTTYAEAFGREGRWIRTDYFLKMMYRGTEEGEAVEISAEHAADVIERWRVRGIVPVVEGVELPQMDDKGD
jgi:hypothetical protein